MGLKGFPGSPDSGTMNGDGSVPYIVFSGQGTFQE